MEARKSVKHSIQHRVPLTYWLPRYKRSDVVPDLIAGVTVGLTLIPQSIAYATLAGLEPEYGLYSAFLGTFIYVVFGTVKEITLGPSALTSLRTFKAPEFAVLMCFLVGCLELICGFMHLTLTKGYLVALVSLPVVAGCKAAAAITIASIQLKGILGLSFETESFLSTWQSILEHIPDVSVWDTILGVSCCIFITCLKSIRERATNIDRKCHHKQEGFVTTAIWLVTTARNAVVVLICAVIAFSIETWGARVPFMLTGRVIAGLPPLQLPPFSAQVGNQTFTFMDMSRDLAPSVAVSSVIAIIAHIAISKAFTCNKSLDASQELMTLGLCNIAGSMVSSMPVSGSFSRSALSSSSGVRTPLAGFYAGILVLLSLSLLTPYFYYIPRATLSAVIICAVMTLVDINIVRLMWRVNKQGAFSYGCTFAASLLFGMPIGIITGIAVDIISLVYTNATPKIKTNIIYNSCDEAIYVIMTPSLGLMFPAADHVRAAIQSASENNDHVTHLNVVLDCSNVYKTDITVAHNMQSLINKFKTHECALVFLHLRPEVLRIFTQVCTSDFHHIETLDDVEPLFRRLARPGCFLDMT